MSDNQPAPEPVETALLDVRLLRLFDLLYANRSVTRSAEQMGQSQPTVSIWLGRLRRELGDPLFVRTPSGMQPTPRADELIPIVREAIAALRRLAHADQGFDPASSRRRFRICMTDASHANLLPRILGHVRAMAPAVTLEAQRIDAATGGRLQSGETDLALGYIPELGPGFYQQSLFTQDWCCLVNPDHPRITRQLTVDDYRREGHIRIVSGTGQSLLADALQQQGVPTQVVLQLPSFLGLGPIVADTDLIATVPRETAETLVRSHGLKLLPCPFDIAGFTVKQHWHARFHRDPANRWLRGVCAALFLR